MREQGRVTVMIASDEPRALEALTLAVSAWIAAGETDAAVLIRADAGTRDLPVIRQRRRWGRREAS